MQPFDSDVAASLSSAWILSSNPVAHPQRMCVHSPPSKRDHRLTLPSRCTKSLVRFYPVSQSRDHINKINRRQCIQCNNDRRHRRTRHLHHMRLYRRYHSHLKPSSLPPSVLTYFSLDFSNYWTAAMYFKHQNGSYKRVPIYPNAQLGLCSP
jgi:hypothetical protein